MLRHLERMHATSLLLLMLDSELFPWSTRLFERLRCISPMTF